MVLMCLGLGGLARAQGTYYDGPTTLVDMRPYGFSYSAYAHDTRLWIPNDVTVIRGVIILGNGAGGDQRNRTEETDWQALARAHGFALMGTRGYVCYRSTALVDEEVRILLNDLALYATASGHPEVAHLPFVLAGWSGGGQMANGINTKIPERVIAFIANKGSNYLAPSSAASLKTPSILVAGQLDGQTNRDGITNLFQNNRPSGALWADAFEWNTGHAEGNVDGVFFTFFDHAIRARYPAGATPLTGPVTLLDLPETSGWLATAPTFNNGLSGTVYPYAGYPGTKTTACWLMDADVANLYRGFATYGPANTAPAVSVTPVSAYGIAPVYTTGQMIQFTVAVDSTFPGWVSADVYDGAVKLGTVTNGGSSTISAVRPWGGRGVTAIARDAAGNERTSIPQPFVVSNTVALANNAATLVQQTSADLNATFCPAWGSYTLTAYWGTVNGGSNAANWQNSAVVGTWAGGDATNVSYTAAGLSSATTYYYTFSAAKSGSQVWAANVLNFITVTPNAPTSSGAALSALEDTATALAAGNFGYTDPLSIALAAVQITSLPALGTLKNGGVTVASGDLPLTVTAANIGNLTYQSASNGNGTPYTTMGIKVMNAGDFWSAGATMTLNVTPVNDAPTSTGGSVTMPKNTDKTFAATDFPFADVDSGDTLGAIRITSLPAQGTLKLNGTAITSVPSAVIPLANIGTLTYTAGPGSAVSDSFKFQVRDATLFSADATMALSIIDGTIIPVINGNFETEYGSNTDKTTNWVKLTDWSLDNTLIGSVPIAGAFSSSADGGSKFTRFTFNNAGAEQNLNTNVAVGDTLSVSFNIGRATNAWVGANTTGVAYFKIGTQYYDQACDVSGQTAGTWKSFTFTTTALNAGALSLGFRVAPSNNNQYVSLDGVSDVSYIPAGGTSTIAATGSPLSALSSTYGTASSPVTFTVGGTNMKAGILVTAPTGFEVSQASGTGYGSTTTVGSAGTIGSAIVYVRLAATAPVAGSYNSQNIVLSSSGVTSANVTTAASGNSVSKVSLTITANNQGKTYGTTQTTPVTGSPAFTASGLKNSETVGTVTLSYGAGGLLATDALGSTSTITPSAAAGGTFSTANYTIGYVAGTLTVSVPPPPVAASGGALTTYTTGGITYNVHTFTSGGTFAATVGGSVQYLVAGGGGGGGSATSGGGGAGQVAIGTLSVTASSYTIAIGAGGTGNGGGNGNNGSSSSITGSGSVTAYGGAGGITQGNSPPANSLTLGSGGGGGCYTSMVGGPAGLGNAGGNGGNNGIYYNGGGGGGAGGAGQASVNAFGIGRGGYGGVGILSSITGSSVYYGGGGGGAIFGGNVGDETIGTGGAGGGGNGGTKTSNATAAANNTGGGGGGAGQFGGAGGAGGSGIVIISYVSGPAPGSYAAWAANNSVTGGVSGDSNNDGVQNGIAYFMSVTGPATNPGLDTGRKVTWPNGGNIPSSTYGTQFVVKTSTDLVTWTPVATNDPKLSNTAGSVSYTLPSGLGTQFVRLVVTPN